MKTKREEIRTIQTTNFSINSKRILRKVIENLEVQYILNKREKGIVKSAVETTLWELFERKEEY